MPTLSLVVGTYQRAAALAAVLASVLAQREPPEEILIADDGSTDDTREVVRHAAASSRVPLRHLWQEHCGFRLTRARNMAIAAARSEYLVFVDGDMLLHPEFVADHRRAARPRYFAQGVRVLLDDVRTARMLTNPSDWPRIHDPGLGGLRRMYLWHAPRTTRLLRHAANHLIAVKGCNQAFWRSDLLAVNGFNEDIVGWGPEDKELCARLDFHGVRRQSLLFGAIACHLHHPPAARERRAANEAILAKTLRERTSRCAHGVDGHPTALIG